MRPPVISISVLIVAISMLALLLCTLMDKPVKRKATTITAPVLEQKEAINQNTGANMAYYGETFNAAI